VIPLATLFVQDVRTRNRRAQHIIRASFRVYLSMLRTVGILKLEVVGGEKLSACKGTLVVANHPTLLDVVILMALLPDATCVGKRQLWRNPFLRAVVSAAGYIPNDYEPEVLIEKCRDTLLSGNNLIIFPEGTRSIPGRPLRFQRGFAHILMASGVNLQPVIITCEPITLVKGEPYYKIPQCSPHFRVEVADAIDARRFANWDSESRAREARRLVAYIESDYSRWLNHG
jgi:1-acyl-sn-glycerol-3-phosphate acyltransferase